MKSATLTFLIAVLALAVASPVVAKKPKRSPCPGGRFLVEGAALVAGDSAAPHEPVVRRVVFSWFRSSSRREVVRGSLARAMPRLRSVCRQRKGVGRGPAMAATVIHVTG